LQGIVAKPPISKEIEPARQRALASVA